MVSEECKQTLRTCAQAWSPGARAVIVQIYSRLKRPTFFTQFVLGTCSEAWYSQKFGSAAGTLLGVARRLGVRRQTTAATALFK